MLLAVFFAVIQDSMVQRLDTAPQNLVVFAHGKESGPWGTKITHLAEIARRRGFEVMSPDYSQSHDPRVRIAQLLELAPAARQALVLVGSSMGGYVSLQACAALRPQALLLMAPALYFPDYDEDPPPAAINAIVHGWHDDVVPAERALRYAAKYRATLHVLNAGHTLNDQLTPLARIFENLLDDALLAGAYRLARYVITAPNREVAVSIGCLDSKADAQLQNDCRVQRNWAIVTACNPAGAAQSAARNAPLIAALREQVVAAGLRFHPAAGHDPAGQWPAETSLLICDPPPGWAEALGREFDQNAIVRGQLGQAPELVWLR
jgi:alpha/beta superfamily hydrolase